MATLAQRGFIYYAPARRSTVSSYRKSVVIAVLSACVFSCAIICSAQSTLPPSWTYSTYFGGSQSDGIGVAARDAAGNVYVAGTTSSSNFPTTAGVYEPVYPGPSGYSVVFVSKFSAAGSLVWSTYLGPGCYQFAAPTGLQVDTKDNVYVAGLFECSGFPTTAGLPHNGSVFLAKLDSTGAKLLNGATLGPTSILSGPQLVLDNKANAFVTGSGPAGDCCNQQTGWIGPGGGIDDFWVAEINAAGSALTWSVQMGGTDEDEVYGMAIDPENKLYVTGYTASVNFPHTAGALHQPGGGRTFVAKLDPTRPPAQSLVYSALLGNPGHNTNDFLEAESMAVDAAGNAYVGAWTYNLGLFTNKWAFQTVAPTVPNAYVFELNASGSKILNGTYLGGAKDDYVGQVTVDGAGNTYVAGFTDSWDFRTTAYGNPDPAVSLDEGYYVKLNPQFAAVSSVEFGSTPDGAGGQAAVPDGAGGLWVGGYSGSQFPTTANAYQPTYQGGYDGILLHTDFAGLCSSSGVAICAITADNHSPERIHFTGQASDAEAAVSIALNIDGMNAYGLHAAQFDTWLPVAAGNHTASSVVQDVNGTQYEEQQKFSVAAQSSCPLNPVNPSLTFCSPLNAAVVKGPLTIQVQANDSVGAPTSLVLYIDGNIQTTIKGQNGSYTYTVTLSPGVHQLSVNGADNYGQFLATSAVARVVN